MKKVGIMEIAFGDLILPTSAQKVSVPPQTGEVDG